MAFSSQLSLTAHMGCLFDCCADEQTDARTVGKIKDDTLLPRLADVL